jgi:bla regulator protein BlaR1
VKRVLVLAFLCTLGLAAVFADDPVAQLRASSPWIAADSTVVPLADGTWKVSDNVNVPFVDDPAVRGVWTAVDWVRDPAAFDPSLGKTTDELYWKTVEFLPGGATRGLFGSFTNTFNTWTKGLYLGTNPSEPTASHYTIQTIANQSYLFVEWKSGDYTIRAKKPGYYVFKKG